MKTVTEQQATLENTSLEDAFLALLVLGRLIDSGEWPTSGAIMKVRGELGERPMPTGLKPVVPQGTESSNLSLSAIS